MNITNSTSLTFTSAKTPRYLYHLTATSNLEKIKKTGVIKKSEDGLGTRLMGVFLFDLPNLIKNWGVSKDWGFSQLTEDLFKHTAAGELSLSVIRVPLKTLNQKNMRVRSLNVLFRDMKNAEHSNEGESIKKGKLLHKKGEAFEYISKEDIPYTKVEVLNSLDNYRMQMYRGGIKSVLLKLFDNTPEEIYIKKAKCADSHEWNRKGVSQVTKALKKNNI